MITRSAIRCEGRIGLTQHAAGWDLNLGTGKSRMIVWFELSTDTTWSATDYCMYRPNFEVMSQGFKGYQGIRVSGAQGLRGPAAKTAECRLWNRQMV